MDMLKKLVLLIFFFSSITSLADPGEIVELENIYSKEYYSNGSLKAEGWIVDSKKEGYWKFYYRNGQLEKEGHLSKDKPTKYWYFYRDNGLLESEGHYDSGTKTNWWLFYDATEKLNHKCQLKNGQKNGYCFIYTDDKIVKAAQFKDGKKTKEWTDLKSFKKDNKLSDLQ
jgi:antitoxin component YwqK of YwqJK toxin-antitoxin module